MFQLHFLHHGAVRHGSLVAILQDYFLAFLCIVFGYIPIIKETNCKQTKIT